jgi:hypothetical protein
MIKCGCWGRGSFPRPQRPPPPFQANPIEGEDSRVQELPAATFDELGPGSRGLFGARAALRQFFQERVDAVQALVDLVHAGGEA